MKRYVLDTSALLTLRDDEPGADRVAELLQNAASEKVRCYGCFISLMEVLYRVWRDESEDQGRLAYQQCLRLPMIWVRDSDSLLLRAAELKAKHPLSLADAWIAACALEHNAILVHKDPEFQPLDIPQDLLPLRAKV
jgi:predicted nucleic acid-binding protein